MTEPREVLRKKLRLVNSSFYVLIPKSWATKHGLRAKDEVMLEVYEDHIIIRPLKFRTAAELSKEGTTNEG